MTGGVYTVKRPPDSTQDPRLTVSHELAKHATPREALAAIRSVEDWRDSMLMVHTPSGWVYANRGQAFAYYDFMLNTKDAGATAAYANVAYRDWCMGEYKSSAARDCRDIIIPDSYFPSVGFFSSLFTGSHRVHIVMKRGDTRPSAIYTRDGSTWLEMRPASLVPGAPMPAGMPRHLARLLLGIIDENPDETTVAESFAGANNLDATFDAKRCRALQNAAISLFPNLTSLECNEEIIRREQAKQKRKETERLKIVEGMRRRAENRAEAASSATQTSAPTIPTPRVKDLDWAYQTLMLGRRASGKEVRDAYKRLTLIYHPDKGGNNEDFKLLWEAYNLINKMKFDGSLFGVRLRASNADPRNRHKESSGGSYEAGPTQYGVPRSARKR